MGKDLNGKELGACIYQRKDKRYEGRYKDRFGKQQSIYDISLRNLKSRLKEIKREEAIASANPCVIDEAITLDEWNKKWMDIFKHDIKESTKIRYKNEYKLYIQPWLGSIRLTNIKDIDINFMIKELRSNGISSGTIKNAMMLLRSMLYKAMKNNLIVKDPSENVKVVTHGDKKESYALDSNQRKAFFEACKGDFYEDFYIVAINTGLRSGEIRALRWKDIDMNSQSLKVTRNLQYNMFDGVCSFKITTPKTVSSVRTVYFNDECAAALNRQFERRKEMSKHPHYEPVEGFEDLLFVTRRGSPLSNRLVDSNLCTLVKKINSTSENTGVHLERLSMHCFRHTYATRCFELSIPPKVVQKQLGHSTIQMTMDLYTHMSNSFCSDEISKLSF